MSIQSGFVQLQLAIYVSRKCFLADNLNNSLELDCFISLGRSFQSWTAQWEKNFWSETLVLWGGLKFSGCVTDDLRIILFWLMFNDDWKLNTSGQ